MNGRTTIETLRVILALSNGLPPTHAEVAEALGVARTSVVYRAALLEAAGLVTGAISVKGRRVPRSLRITAAGANLLRLTGV